MIDLDPSQPKIPAASSHRPAHSACELSLTFGLFLPCRAKLALLGIFTINNLVYKGQTGPHVIFQPSAKRGLQQIVTPPDKGSFPSKGHIGPTLLSIINGAI